MPKNGSGIYSINTAWAGMAPNQNVGTPPVTTVSGFMAPNSLAEARTIRLLEHCITDLRSAKAVIPLLKKQGHKEVLVPIPVFHEIQNELKGRSDYNVRISQRVLIGTGIDYMGVHIQIMGPGII